MESGYNPKFTKYFEQKKEQFGEDKVVNKKIVEEVGNIFSTLGNYGKQIEQIQRQRVQSYVNNIKTRIVELDDVNKLCHFLLDEKREYGLKIIEAKTTKNDLDKEYYQTVINEIIDPLFKIAKEELEFKKSNPPPKQNNIEANYTTPIVPETQVKEDVKIIELIKEPEIFLIKEPQKEIIENPILPEGFEQIESKATKEEILHYFMILSKEKNHENKTIYMEQKHIVEFVKKNFKIFNVAPTGNYFPINLIHGQKLMLSYFIYQFYKKYESGVLKKKKKYTNLLIHNFDLFRGDKYDTLYLNLSKKPKKRIISIENYF